MYVHPWDNVVNLLLVGYMLEPHWPALLPATAHLRVTVGCLSSGAY